jgi:hypothetical protein
MQYYRLFEGLVRLYRSNDEVLFPFYSFDWELRREMFPFFVVLVQYVPFEKLRKTVRNLINQPLTYANDRYFALAYAAVLKFVPDERIRMMDYLVANVFAFLTSPGSEAVWFEVINLATTKQKESLLLRFEGILRQTRGFR